MVYDYIITFKKRNDMTVDAISQLMYLFALLAFSYFAYTINYVRPFYLGFDLAILIIWTFCTIRKQKTGFTLFRLGLFVATIGWLLAPGGRRLLAVLYAIAGLIEKQVKFPEEVGFSEKSVVLNTFPKKEFRWNEISNVLIKDNLITIDFLNNKIIQKEVNEDVPLQMEKEFNHFCKIQLEKVKQSVQPSSTTGQSPA